MKKVLGRKFYQVRYVMNRLPLPPFKEQVMIRDFTGK